MNPIEIYTWATCPYCRRAKQLLDRKGVAYTEYPVDIDDEAYSEMLDRANGQYTVPQIFVGDRHIGGSDDLYRLEQAGELDEILGLIEARTRWVA
ncbi:glutaredoxin 3 [filamentous cyanobacterium CCP4]|nr:glutaredoxin 3 [filamentous cyanobacterium CCP4]